MIFKDIIAKKRNGHALDTAEIREFVSKLASGDLPPEQAAALAMAIMFQSMSARETACLTNAMAESGKVIDWKDAALAGPVIDKHSTGGVGDKISFLLAPIIAACDCFVPMVSGRGLGHTGGTVDKLESIPGYKTMLDMPAFKKIVRDVGCSIVCQSADIAPADGQLYAIRDITGTVESLPLITASILSKKLAAGIDGLVMDVKVGSGAFMTSTEDATALANSILETANALDLKASAIISDMSEVLGHSAGNAVEIVECVEFLTGEQQDPRLKDVVLSLATEMLLLAGKEPTKDAALERANRALDSGAAAEKFEMMVAAHGGPADFLTHHQNHLPKAKLSTPIFLEQTGFVSKINVRDVGNAIILLGGGRNQRSDEIDHRVGFSAFAPIGAKVDQSHPIAFVHANEEEDITRATDLIRRAVSLSPQSPEPNSVILDVLRQRRPASEGQN